MTGFYDEGEMQAVTKLEKSFNQALAKLGTGAGNDGMAAENARLSKRINDLEAVKANKDAKIKGLRDKVNRAVQREEDANKQIDVFKKAQTDAQKEITNLQARIKEITATKVDALKQVDALKAQMNGANAGDAKNANAAMQAELKALRKQREADLAEINAILDKLTPLVEGK